MKAAQPPAFGLWQAAVFSSLASLRQFRYTSSPMIRRCALPILPIAVVFVALLAACDNRTAPPATSAPNLITAVELPAAVASTPTSLPTLVAAIPQSVTAHIVQPGENLFRIALNYGVPLETLAAANNISDPTVVRAGQTLIIPIASSEPTAVAIAVPTTTSDPHPAQAAVAASLPPALNGLPIDAIVVLTGDVQQHVREIYAAGQALGRNPRAFSKIGDSTIQNPYFLARFDGGAYNLGDYAYLQPVIDHFAGSFGREGMAVRRGLHSWSILNPAWADKTLCQPDETPIACEFRVHNPSVVLIRLGANDSGAAKLFDQNMRQIVEHSIANGVIPVLGTKADRHEGPDNTNNNILRQIAADYRIPLWDFDQLAQTLPYSGLAADGVHMTSFYAHDYTLPEALQRGHGAHNLSALMVLYEIWRVTGQGDR